MRLLVATRSAGKRAEARQLLADSGLDPVFPEQVGLPETPDEAGLELGETLEANARAKAENFARKSFLPTLADDSGLEVFALGGEPGVRSRRWAGVEGPGKQRDEANNAMLLSRLRGAPPDRRRARYRCVLAWIPRPGAIPQVFEGACTGAILAEPRGSGGFGYDPLFRSDELEKTFGEASPEEKNAVSHRGRAFQAFLRSLTEGR